MSVPPRHTDGKNSQSAEKNMTHRVMGTETSFMTLMRNLRRMKISKTLIIPCKVKKAVASHVGGDSVM
jgi:hypothetical protein